MDYPGEKLAIKLWETLIEKGIGGALAPYQAKRVGVAQAEARAEELKILAHAEAEVKKIQEGKLTYDTKKFDLPALSKKGTAADIRIEPSLETTNLLGYVAQNQYKYALRKEINLSNTIIKTEAMLLESNNEVSNESIESDWLHRWKDYAQEVSTEDAQSL